MNTRDILEQFAAGDLSIDQAEYELQQKQVRHTYYNNRLTGERLEQMKIRLEPYVTSGFYTALDKFEEITHHQLEQLIGQHLSPDYLASLNELGLEASDKLVVNYAIHDVSIEYLTQLVSYEFADTTPKLLLKARIHDVNPNHIGLFHELGLDVSLRKVIKMSIHNVMPDYVQSMIDMGYESITPNQLISLKIHNISLDYVRQLIDLGYHPSANMIKKMGIHNVTVDYIGDMVELGFGEVSPRDLIKSRIHGLTAEFIHQIHTLFPHIELHMIIKLKIHNVNTSYIEELKDAELTDLSVREILKLSIHNVDGSYISRLREAGLTDLTPKQLVRCRNHGVSPEYIRELSGLGFDDLDLDLITNLKIHNIDGKYIRTIYDAGIDDISLSEIKQFRIHGVIPAYISMVISAGYHPSPQQLIQAKIHGVQQQDLEEGQQQQLSLAQVIRYRIHK